MISISLLQYGFERKRINKDNSDQFSDEDKDNPNENVKKPRINNSKTFKHKWLAEFLWLNYDENKKRMYCILCIQHKMKNKFATEGATNISKKSAIKEHANTKDHNNAEKLEKARIQMETLQQQTFSSDAYTNHIIGVMRVVYFLAKKNLPISLLLSVVELIKESGLSILSDGTISYVNHTSGNEFLEAITKYIFSR
ncbi:unnamed protein product [Rhizophagus irregularis]|nr:unnamed protein product [Rhizophagus irregularis]